MKPKQALNTGKSVEPEIIELRSVSGFIVFDLPGAPSSAGLLRSPIPATHVMPYGTLNGSWCPARSSSSCDYGLTDAGVRLVTQSSLCHKRTEMAVYGNVVFRTRKDGEIINRFRADAADALQPRPYLGRLAVGEPSP